MLYSVSGACTHYLGESLKPRDFEVHWLRTYGYFVDFSWVIQLRISHLRHSSCYLGWCISCLLEKISNSWLGLGITESIIILSSVHYGFLMMSLAMAIYFVLSLARIDIDKQAAGFSIKLPRTDILFIAKTLLVILLLAGHQFYSTFRFVSHNERLIANFSEIPPNIGVALSSLFLPIGTLLDYPKNNMGLGRVLNVSWFWHNPCVNRLSVWSSISAS